MEDKIILKPMSAMHAREALKYLTGDSLFEIRVLRPPKPPLVGYFENVEKLHELPTENAYFTMHFIHEGLICRAPNRFIEGIKATSFDDVIRYRWLFIDIDPRRPSGIPASEPEREHAQNAVRATIRFMREILNDRTPAILDTGNGYHLFYPLEPIKPETLQQFYKYLREKLVDTPEIIYDINNKPLLSRVPGTINKKGFPYKDRVYRPVQLLRTHSGNPITEQELAHYVPTPKETHQHKPTQHANDELPRKVKVILEYLKTIKQHSENVEVITVRHSGNRTRYILRQCIFKIHAQTGHAALIEEPNGFIRYHCFSEECRKKVQEMRVKNPYFPLPPPQTLDNTDSNEV